MCVFVFAKMDICVLLFVVCFISREPYATNESLTFEENLFGGKKTCFLSRLS